MENMALPMPQVPAPAGDHHAWRRPARIPAATLPAKREDRRASATLSLMLHGLILALFIVTPFAVHEELLVEQPQGAGGPGPAGGGGGGHMSDVDHVQYVHASAPPPAQTPVVKPVLPPPPVKTVIPPPQDVPKEPIVQPKLDLAMVPGPTSAALPGTGADGTNGNGPGSGGGRGSGTGPGAGSATGPGTGGGNQANFPPTPTELFIPPLPMPDKVRGFHLIAEYDIDERGRILDLHFSPTPDRDYNKRLDEVLRSFRFKPGTKPDGTPIRMKAQIIYDF